MPKADFLTGVIVFLLGVYMVLEGARMPGAGGFIEAGGEPGRVPVMLGVILALLAMVMIVRSVSRGGHRLIEGGKGRSIEFSGWLRSGIAAVICSTYALGLLGGQILGWQIDYRAATALFVFLFIVGFEWLDAPEMGRNRWAWLCRRRPAMAAALSHRLRFVPSRLAPYLWLAAVALLEALIVAFAVAYLFEQQLYVKLP